MRGRARHAADARHHEADLCRDRRPRFRQGACAACAFGGLIGLVARELAGEKPTAARWNPNLFRRFETLLELHHLKRWSVSDYATALSITPTHLNRVTRAATGDTASHLILNRLIREARRNLAYTNLPVSTIAYALGFEDPAYFSRVYAAATGRSPSAFRTQLHGGEE